MSIYVLDQFYLSITLLVTVGYQLAFFLVAYTFKFDKVTDFAGGTNFVTLALLTFFLSQVYHTRQIIALLLVSVWGCRLAGNQLYRIIKTNSDRRFDGIRENFFSFLGFWVAQMIWVWTVSLPVTFLNSYRLSEYDPAFGSATDIIGIVLWAIGFAIELVADLQKNYHYSHRSSPLDFARRGVWSVSRHPNYFGEILLWWGIFLLCLQPTLSSGISAGWASIAGPLFTMAILLFLSGLPYVEKPTQKKFYESAEFSSYQDYLNSTSILIPMPPSIFARLPFWVKQVFFFEWPLYHYSPAWEANVSSQRIYSTEDLEAPN
ncbi:DUF1295-domain-containing protein [Basidiobolus meristosporus CBS 931.73]|uniref:DUF1295-domain-containing protein n=1 Tax=Basidiobolus meristosporus CBS 931.73 TaxID=1314790 RepID=A0A1Y1Z6I2_9FUNG|nr:DUF1295-domain-containing protein [Basidiobolus meristosporus CBS 931.73]|eukprot:ORY05850.1 DUF1295-domain-containing protein [Basidiobolus meristosporus CBS 931.73]